MCNQYYHKEGCFHLRSVKWNDYVAYFALVGLAVLIPVLFITNAIKPAYTASQSVVEDIERTTVVQSNIDEASWIFPPKPVAVTAYTSYVGQTDSSPCISADGSNICDRFVLGEKLCATNDHPMGTLLFVPGYGDCVVVDRMNRRYTGTGRVDVYMGYDTEAALDWGIKHVQVEVL